ncbi:MAG: NAD(P)-dependent oxidoreductase [bacterium]|nr:NAD(P)-dependent oxidoreductase [bacterium]
MRILADRHIPWVEEAFGGLGTLVLLDRFTPEDLIGADALLVRSTQQVDRNLFALAHPRFVGTATAGQDHVDLEFLNQTGISYAYAPGCNAMAVAQWVIASLLRFYGSYEKLRSLRLGIVGLGAVGGRLSSLALLLGLEVRASDPPKERASEPGPWMPLEELLRWSDIVTLHTPLTTEGADKTFHLIAAEQLALLKPKCLLVNAARGGVVDEQALKPVANNLGGLILDTWESEPELDRELLALTSQASPHVAGYSLEAKLKGTSQIQEAFCRFFEMNVPALNPKLNHFRADVAVGVAPLMDLIGGMSRDDAALRSGGDFKQLRNLYPLRREWSSVELSGHQALSEAHGDLLAKMGFLLV